MKRILVAAILASGMIYCPQLSGQTGGELETYAAKYPNEAIIYLKDELHLNIRVDKTGLVISNTANQEKLQLEDRGTFFSKGGIEYSGWSPLDQIQASTLVPDGKKFKTYPVKDFTTNDVMEDDIFYNDTKEVTFYFPELTKGAHLKLDYTLSIQEPRFLPSFYFGNYAPTEHAEYTVTFPENLELKWFTSIPMRNNCTLRKQRKKAISPIAGPCGIFPNSPLMITALPCNIIVRMWWYI